MRLSKPDEKDPTKRRHFEISIDSPFHILSCKATQGNIFLPAYSDPSSDPAVIQEASSCGCPGAPMTKPRSASNSRINLPSLITDLPNSNNLPSDNMNIGPNDRGLPRSFTSGSGGLSRPEQAHIAHEPSGRDAPRPMHLIRAPSFAPPSFDELEPPPPLITPPPEYASIVGDNDRETVLTDYFNRLSYFEEQDDDRGLGRVDVPLTPGGRVHRSMDVPREWVRLGDATVQ
jgi:arrestin-related trafficking adapter 3/6